MTIAIRDRRGLSGAMGVGRDVDFLDSHMY